VFQGASRSRRDCGNLEAVNVLGVTRNPTAAAVAATAAILRRYTAAGFSLSFGSRSRRDCGNLEAVEIGKQTFQHSLAAVAATAAILRRTKGWWHEAHEAEPQSPRLRQS